MASLTSLPAELLAMVLGHLEPDALLPLRQTCKYIESAVFVRFGTEFFGTVGVMAHPRSLDILRRISEHAELRKYVRHVWITPDFYTSQRGCLRIVNSSPHDSPVNNSTTFDAQSQLTLIKSLVDKHEDLIATGALRTYLTNALDKFPNVDTVGIRYFNERASQSSHHASRDRCWGRASLKRVTSGIDPIARGPDLSGVHTPDENTTTKVFAHLLAALGRTSLKISKVYTSGESKTEIGRILPDHLRLSPVEVQSLSTTFANLREMRLCMGKFKWLKHNVPRDAWGLGLAALLNAPEHLQVLQLWLERCNVSDQYPIETLRNAVRHIQPSRLNKLREVELEGAEFGAETLLTLLLPSKPTLRRLTLNTFDIPERRILSRGLAEPDWITSSFDLHMLRIKYVGGMSGECDLVYEDGVGRMAGDPNVSKPTMTRSSERKYPAATRAKCTFWNGPPPRLAAAPASLYSREM